MLETTDEKSQTDVNIKSIEKDAERIRTLSRSENTENKEVPPDVDVDDLSKYTDEDEGVKVLKDTTSMNRKAIFHDLNRLKHWRESMDQTKTLEKNEKEVLNDIPAKEQESNFTPIMETNMDIILSSLPDVKSDEEGDANDMAAIEKLNNIEKKLSKQYSLQK